MRDRWRVVELHRFKREETISTHWWRWTAELALGCYLLLRPDAIVDVWKIRE